jgi:hypothetical protein
MNHWQPQLTEKTITSHDCGIIIQRPPNAKAFLCGIERDLGRVP